MSDEHGEFNVGDEIAIFHGFSGDSLDIVRIDRITPSGQLVCGNKRLTPNLRVVGSTQWSRTYATRATDELREQFHKNRLVGKLRRIEFERLPMSKLREIAAIVDRKDD